MSPPTLSQEELNAYLDHVQLPLRYRGAEKRELHNLDLLEALHIHHITTIPYENLGLHYTRNPHISTDVHHILAKALCNGRGGYCMEGNLLFNSILRALGFNAYLTGARIRLRAGNVPQGPWLGWQHVVNMVTLDDGRVFIADVAFGGDGPIRPMPLKEGTTTPNLGTQELRFVKQPLPDAVTNQLWWTYQYRNDPNEAWNSYYCFNGTEFLVADFVVMNGFIGFNPDHFHRVVPIIVRFIRGGEDDSKVVGKFMLANATVKRNVGGETEVIVDCKTEAARISALQQYFDMKLTAEEQHGIRGRASELTGTD